MPDGIVEDQDLPVRTSIGRRTMTASQLNMSWTVAPANARRKSPTSVIWPMETSVLVTEVPMLAPITIGIACLTSKTEKTDEQFIETTLVSLNWEWIMSLWEDLDDFDFDYIVVHSLSAATMLTTMDVLVDELWTRTVDKTPIITPQIGLLRSLLLLNTSPAALPKGRNRVIRNSPLFRNYKNLLPTGTLILIHRTFNIILSIHVFSS